MENQAAKGENKHQPDISGEIGLLDSILIPPHTKIDDFPPIVSAMRESKPILTHKAAFRYLYSHEKRLLINYNTSEG